MSLEALNKKIQDLYTETDRRKSLDIAIDAANEVIKVLKPSVDNLLTGEDALDRAIPVNQFPNQKVENWFSGHPYFTGDKVALRFYEDEMVETKFYWLNDTSTKARVSAGVMLTPNWEDSELTRNDNYKLGVDFFLTHDTKSLLVVISNMGNLRILELNNKLSHTQYEIFTNLKSALQLDSREQSHQILWDSLALSEVNKKFYAGVAEQFNILLNHLITSGRDKEDAKLFASRLLGRLLFVWFLRRKNIVSESYGYFDIKDNNSTDYYNSKLKILFFETLNLPVDKRKTSDVKTPYLNGGLFEAHQNDWSNELVDFPKGYFNGLYEHLEKYNFTTDESSPEYEQVAIDPEMLGRVFESLLATQITETGDQARKAKGTFYTPREVVSYMCKESLREFLYTKLSNQSWNEGVDKLLDTTDSEWELSHSNSKRNLWGEANLNVVPARVISALDELTVLDPACGSGAFPMGMLHLILKTYERLDARFDPYKTKLQIIQNNIFGVDIEPMAVEISRLRAWLSLVVDDEDDEKVEPLPNLDFKFVCANSLIPLESAQQGDLFNTDIHEKLADVRREFFNARKPHTKRVAIDKYESLTNSTGLFDDKRTKQLRSFKPFKNQSPAEFFDSDYMFGVDNFNIVIGNPPYVSVWKINKKDKTVYQGLYDTALGHYDLYVLFYERALKSLVNGGILAFITSNKWMAQSYGYGLRKLFLSKQVLKLLDFSAHQVFESATVDTQITIIKNENKELDYELLAYRHDNTSPPDFDKLNYSSLNTSIFKQNDELNFKINLTEDSVKIINKINSKSIPLDEILYTSKGAELHSTKNKIKKEVYIKDEYDEGLVNYIEGKYFEKYRIKDRKYLDYQPTKHKAPVFPELFESEKIIVKNVVGRGGIHAILDKDKLYNNDALINAVPYFELANLNYRQITSSLTEDKILESKKYPLEFILAVINSKVSTWYFMQLFANGLHFYPRHLRSVRIPKIEGNQEIVNIIVESVNEIHRRISNEMDFSDLEKTIDSHLYELYNLDTEDVKLISESH